MPKTVTIWGRGCDRHIASGSILVHFDNGGVRGRARLQRLRGVVLHRGTQQAVQLAVPLLELAEKELPFLRIRREPSAHADEDADRGAVGALVVPAHVREHDALAVAVLDQNLHDF